MGQYKAMSLTEGVCVLSCVPLPEDTIEYAANNIIEAKVTTPPPITTTLPAVIHISPEEELAARIAAMSGGASTETVAPILQNQTAYWINYERLERMQKKEVEVNFAVNLIGPSCYLGVLLSPMCVFLLVMLFVVVLFSVCICFRLFQYSMRERWPSNENEVALKIFDTCATKVTAYRDPPRKPGAAERSAVKMTEVWKATRHCVQGFDTRSSPTGLAKIAPEPEVSNKYQLEPVVKIAEEPPQNVYLFQEERIEILDCRKNHGLTIRQDEALVCPTCTYGVVRYVPYKTTLELVDMLLLPAVQICGVPELRRPGVQSCAYTKSWRRSCRPRGGLMVIFEYLTRYNI